jgi:hypothetical protein
MDKNTVLSIGTKKQVVNSPRTKNFNDLIVVGIMGRMEKRHRKKVQKLNDLLEMRMEKKKQIKELMAKRAGTFNMKDNML